MLCINKEVFRKIIITSNIINDIQKGTVVTKHTCFKFYFQDILLQIKKNVFNITYYLEMDQILQTN